MNIRLRLSILCLCVSGALVRAGVQEDFPEFFPKVPDHGAERNGWDLLPTLTKISQADRKGLPDMSSFNPERLSQLDVERARAIATRFAKDLRILESIMDAPRLHSEQWSTFNINGTGDFNSLKAALAAQVMLGKAAADAREGNVRQGVETGLRVLRFGLRACEAEPMLVDLAVASTLIRMGAGTVAAMAVMPGMDGAALRKAAKDLDACDTAGAAMRQGLRGEARWVLWFSDPLLRGGEARRDTVMELAVADKIMSVMFGKDAGKKEAPVNEKELREAWKKELPESVKAALRDADKVDWGAHTRTQAEYFRELWKADNRSIPAFNASFHPPDTDVAVKGTALQPYYESKVDFETAKFYMHLLAGTSARIREARAILLLRAWELDHGRLPETLDELIPAFWASVPADPFDGKPLRYNAATRMVWSAGMNLKDEKGAGATPGKDEPDDLSLTLPEVK